MSKSIFYCLILFISSFPISLLSQNEELASKPEIGISFDYDNTGSSVISLRAGGNVFYGLLAAGYNWKALKDEAMTWQVGGGAHIGHGLIFNTNIEARAALYSNFNKMNTFQFTVNLLPGLKLTDYLECYIGPNIGYMQTKNPDNTRPLNMGITLWEEKNSSRLKHLYIGFLTGIYYRF